MKMNVRQRCAVKCLTTDFRGGGVGGGGNNGLDWQCLLISIVQILPPPLSSGYQQDVVEHRAGEAMFTIASREVA